MGNNLTSHRYSFKDRYYILQNPSLHSTLYKLKNPQTKQLYIGRQLSCNDCKQSYQLQSIIHQKIHNPSPYLTTLINYQSQHQQSYCLNTHKFYLLYKHIPKLLIDQITSRKISNRHFQLQQIDLLITRITKAIKYLYDIYHYHGSISSKTITWPITTNPPTLNIQLIDQWILPISTNKSKNFKPKNQIQLNSKHLQQCIDLGNLGLLSQSLLTLRNYPYTPQQSILHQFILYKISILTSQYYPNRNQIYNIINNQNSFQNFKQNSKPNSPIISTANTQIITNNPPPLQQNNSPNKHSPIPTKQKHYQTNSPSHSQSHSQSHPQSLSNHPQLLTFLQQNHTLTRPHSSFPSTRKPSPDITIFHSQIFNHVPSISNISFSNTSKPLTQTPSYQTINVLPEQQQTRNKSSQGTTSVTLSNNPSQYFLRNASVGRILQSPIQPKRDQRLNTISYNSNSFNITIPPTKAAKVPSNIHTFAPTNNANKYFRGTSNISTTLNTTSYNLARPPNNFSINFKSTPQFTSSIPHPPPNHSYFKPSPQFQNFSKCNLQATNKKSYQVLPLFITQQPTNKPTNNNTIHIPNNSNKPYLDNIPQTGFTYSFGKTSTTAKNFLLKNQNLAHKFYHEDKQTHKFPSFLKNIKRSPFPSQIHPQPFIPSTIQKLQIQIPLNSPSESQNKINLSITPSTIPSTTPSTTSVPDLPLNKNQKIYQQKIQLLNNNKLNKDLLFTNKQIKTTPQSQTNVSSPHQQINQQTIKKITIQNSSPSTNNILPTSPATTPTPNKISEKAQNIYLKLNPTPIQPQLQQSPKKQISNQNTPPKQKISTTNIIPTQLDQNADNYQYQNYQQYVKCTPQKPSNTITSQPFSAIPQVSQKSISLIQDDDKQYIIEDFQNGSRYQGYKSNGMRNGKGRFYYQQGSYYDGQWKDNNMHGYGKLFYTNKKIAYEGEWFLDQFHGKGKVYNDQPIPIIGMFDYTNFDNLQQKWKYYEGDLYSDSKQGHGKILLSNDQYYQGQFKNDKVQGQGIFVNFNGQIIHGIWEDNKFISKF